MGDTRYTSRHLQLIFLLTASTRLWDARLSPLDDKGANDDDTTHKNKEAQGDRMGAR